MDMHAHAIPQLEPSSTGIHLIWIGPRSWLYSPGGWSVQRRVFQQNDRVDCDNLTAGDLSLLRMFVEMERRLGILLYREGFFPMPLPTLGTAASPGLPAQILTYTLNEPQSFVRVSAQASSSFALARRAGKAVAVSSAPVAGSATHELRALGIEEVIVYLSKPESIRYCIPVHLKPEEDEWRDVPFIVKEMQVPLQELIPSLNGPDGEFNAAAARVPIGTDLDPDEFRRLADTLRAGVKLAGPPRPLDQVLLLREDIGAEFEELIALDPLRVMMIHPVWRRALGFGFFDEDPALVVGETYEYRITGRFPAEDLADEIFGFHTIPSQTLLPAEFYLSDVHFLLPQPARVERSPGTPLGSLTQISRRGIHLLPREQEFWQLPVPFDEWSLVLDLPQPVEALILELHPDHALEFEWKASDGSLGGPKTVPPGPRPRLELPEPARHIRLTGKGFLFAVRIPRGPVGIEPVSVVLPPVTLADEPRPAAPLAANLRNLQQPPASGSLPRPRFLCASRWASRSTGGLPHSRA